MIDLTLSKSRLFNSITPAEGFFCLTNAYVELAIIIVLAYEKAPVLDSLAALWNSRCWLRQAPVRVGRRRLLYRHLADAGHGTAAGAEHVRLNRGGVGAPGQSNRTAVVFAPLTITATRSSGAGEYLPAAETHQAVDILPA